MHARIARFEDVDRTRIDSLIAELRQQMEAARTGEMPAEFAEQARVLNEKIARFVQLVDRERGTFVAIVFCRTEADLREVDAALNALSPGEGGGRRTSVELLEVAIDTALE